jgi:tetratricopeptide (TPR) repeat protein
MLIAALSLALASFAFAQSNTADPAADAAYAAFEARDYAEAERLSRALLSSVPPDDADGRFRARHILIAALYVQRKCDEALSLADRHTSEFSTITLTWSLAFRVAYHCENFPRAAETLAAIARIDPDALTRFNDHAIVRAAMWSDDLALLSHLANGAWTPHEHTTDLSSVRLALIASLMSRNDLSQAREVAQGLVLNTSTDLATLVMLFTDRRFERIITADAQIFDFDTILDWQLSNARAAAAAEPDRSMAVYALANTLFKHGRYDEALTLIDGALARADDFADIDEGRPWLMNTRAHLLEAKGDASAAMDALRAAAEVTENGLPNVSQRLNYAAMLTDYDRPREALAQLEGFNPSTLSGYGRMVMLRILVCSHANLGNQAEMRRYLNQALETQESSLLQVYIMGICANDLDLAARTLIARLDHPTERREVIVEQSEFLPDPVPDSDLDITYRARDDAVRERRDVARALRRAVNPRTFPIRHP